MKLNGLSHTVESLDIGASDAESDWRLTEDFIATPQALAALTA